VLLLLPHDPASRDTDQSCYDSQHSRLAELSLDSRISRPHDRFSNGPAYGAGYGGAPSHAHAAPHYHGNGAPVGSGPYGDDDYYGSSNGSASNIRRPYGGPPPASYGRGPYAPAGPPGSGTGPAGPAGPGMPAAMGNGPVGSAHFGAGPQHAGPREGASDAYVMGPSRPYAAPVDDEDVWYPPPPPPPPRACLSPNGQQPAASAVQHRAATPATAPQVAAANVQQGEPATRQQPAVESAAVRAAALSAAARPAGDGVAKGVVSAQEAAPSARRSSSGGTELAVVGRVAAAQVRSIRHVA
jgi:hypothetical protein